MMAGCRADVAAKAKHCDLGVQNPAVAAAAAAAAAAAFPQAMTLQGRQQLTAWQRRCHTHSFHAKPCCGTQNKPRTAVIRRTSEHWYEDEEEFDGVAGEILLPKTLHFVCLPQTINTQDTSSEKQQSSSHADGLLEDAKILLQQSLAGANLTAGFTSPQCSELAESLWNAIGAGGPPYFRKTRQRDGLCGKGREDFLQELLGQNWRVELDYGLGATLTPREHLLLIGIGADILPLFKNFECRDVSESELATNSLQLVQVDVKGWNIEAESEMQPLNSWRDLFPRCVRLLTKSVNACKGS